MSRIAIFCRNIFLIGSICSFLVFHFFNLSQPVQAAVGVNQQMTFQGRLLNQQGAVVPDGSYNIEFKIYKDGDGQAAGNPSGSLLWTESHLNAQTKGIQVKNGYLSVQLGSVNPFASQVDWNQDTLWLSMNVGNTNASCASFSVCAPDGEMTPMKRLSSTPYAMNAGLLGGLSSAAFLQLANGLQTDSSLNASSIAINKTGAGNFLTLQANGIETFALNNSGSIQLGANANQSLSVATASAGAIGRSLAVNAGDGGSGTGSNGGNLTLQGGNAGGTNANGGGVLIEGGAGSGTGTAGPISIGTTRSSTIQIGGTALAGTQTINIGTNAVNTGTTNVTIGTNSLAAGGTTRIQSKGSTTIATNGVVRGVFDTSGSLYLGNGVTAAAPSNFTISGTGSTTTAVTGGALTLQGGNATVGNANGGNLVLRGGNGIGTGASGLVVFTTPTFSTTANDANCYPGGTRVAASCTITSTSVNNSSAILVGFSTDGQTATLPDPTILTPGRVVYITAANASNDFTLLVNGGGMGNSIAMRQNTTATMIWNGADWTAAGASSSTTLQSAYDNTLQSAGGAELIVSKTSNTNGLTIRDSSTNPVNGTLLSVQTSSAAGLLSVNSNVREYTTNSGAETIGSSGPTSFPANTWAAINGASVSRHATAGDYIATGQGSVVTTTSTTSGSGVSNRLSTTLNPNMNYNVSFTTRLLSGTFTNMDVYYSADGVAATVPCTTDKTATTSVWTKVNCTFAAPASGITASNAIFIRQTGAGTTRTFYVDNLSVAIAADYNYASDGSASDSTNFATNWSFAGLGAGSVSRNISDGYDASDSASVTLTTGAANAGIRNRLSINPITNTLYRVSVYAKIPTGSFNDFKIRYSRDGSTTSSGNYVDCVDYNTQIVTTSGWTQVTCYIDTDGTTPTNPHVYFVGMTASARTFMVDNFSMTLTTNTAPNVQIGGGVNGGPTTLLTLDKGASAPIASNNDALLGSMYYDTTLGKLQCYEADGWGACGSSPDNIITISPEYTNAVLHGTGIGTMVSDLCSDTLNINDGSAGQATICGTNETYNFYKWTSPQPSSQTYSIYVTYQLPATFKSFASGSTSIKGRTDSSGAAVQYQVYRNDEASGLSACGPAVAVASGAASSWQTGVASGGADPSTCGFVPGNSIVFKINVTASQNANAYVGNLNFTFSNR